MHTDRSGLGVGRAAGVLARVVHLGVPQGKGANSGVVLYPHAHFHLLHFVVSNLVERGEEEERKMSVTVEKEREESSDGERRESNGIKIVRKQVEKGVKKTVDERWNNKKQKLGK